MNWKIIAIIISIVILIIGIAGIISIRNHFGDVRPVFFTPSQQQPQSLSSPSSKQNMLGADMPFTLQLPQGFHVGLFAKKLGSPRDLQISPQGTLLVSIPDKGTVVALPDTDHNGIADENKIILSGLRRPHGLAFFNNKLYVAAETSVMRYMWDEKTMTATLDRKLFNLPAGGRHVTRTITFDTKETMFVSLGSTCDVCVESHPWLAAVILSDAEGNNPHVYAKGLRNATFITRNPGADQIWVTEMGRDFLGDNDPADEINILEPNGDYGWPYCYGNRQPDASFKSPKASCATTIPPVYQIPAHSAPLGLTFIPDTWPSDMNGDILVAYHGSWNRSVPTGYKVVRLHREGGKVTNATDFATGFLVNGASFGRPVDVEFDSQGHLFISDDKAGNVYVVNYIK